MSITNIYGGPISGKATLARVLAEQTGLNIFETHADELGPFLDLLDDNEDLTGNIIILDDATASADSPNQLYALISKVSADGVHIILVTEEPAEIAVNDSFHVKMTGITSLLGKN